MSDPFVINLGQAGTLNVTMSPTQQPLSLTIPARSGGNATLLIDTTENWNQKTQYVPTKGTIIVYSDHGQIDDGYGNTIDVPGIKIADGSAYLLDQPFVGADVRYEILQALSSHTNDWSVHVSDADRERWNNKLNYTINDGNLIFNRN